MKNKISKKWVILIEAIISVGIFLILLWWLTYIYAKVHEFDDKVNEMLAYSTYTRIINSLEFIKERNLSIGAEEGSYWSSQNIKYPGWTRLKITSWSTQTLNDLNGSYELTDINCPTWLVRCLREIPAWTFSEIPLSSKFTLYSEDSTWRRVEKSSEEQFVRELIWTCTVEYASDCLGYRLDISNLVSWRNPNLDFTNASWILESVKMKAIKVTIQNWKNIKTYNYILSIF